MTKHVKFFFEESWLLLVSAVVFGLALASLYGALKPRIDQNEIDKFNRLAGGMLTEAKNFEVAAEDLPIDIGKGKTLNTDIKKGVDADGNTVGWAFVCEGAGFQDKIKLVVTVDKDFEKLAGYGVLFSNETPGFGDKMKNDYYRNQFIGAPTTELELSKTGDATQIDSGIVAMTGATVTSEAVVKIVNNFVSQVKTRMKEKGLI